MALAGDSILVTPGSVATVATHTVSAKEHQVVMVADADGHIRGSKTTYVYRTGYDTHVASASSIAWDIFNADATLLVRVLSIAQIPDIVSAVTGVSITWEMDRTTAVGTGGTAITAWLPDLSQTAMDADITFRLRPSGGATVSTILAQWQTSAEETNNAAQIMQMVRVFNAVPAYLRETGQGILLRQNQGMRVLQNTNTDQGRSNWEVVITVE